MRWLLLASIAAVACNNAPLVALEGGGGQTGQGLTGNNGPNGGEGGAGGESGQGGIGGIGGMGGTAPECECAGPCDAGEVVMQDSATGTCYRSVGISGTCEASKSFEQASIDCEAWGGNLATPSTALEIDFIVANGLLDPTVPDYLVGGRSTTGVADLAWVDGEPFVYAPQMPPWAGVEPVEPSGTSCVEMYFDGSLNADICESACGYVCERDPVDVSL